jgi:hypothetical protein
VKGGRFREACRALSRAWAGIFRESGRSALDQVGTLLAKAGDLRGATFVADDVGSDRDNALKVFAIYWDVLKAQEH